MSHACPGFVRDIYTKVENDDIDLVIEGDGGQYADALAEQFGIGPAKHHEQFQTAVVTLKKPLLGLKIGM